MIPKQKQAEGQNSESAEITPKGGEGGGEGNVEMCSLQILIATEKEQRLTLNLIYIL